MHTHEEIERRHGGAASGWMALAPLIVLAVAGCAGTIAPAPAWLPARNRIASFRYGAFADVRTLDPGVREDLRGELIAVTRDSIYVLTETHGLVGLASSEIRSIAVRTHQPPGGAVVIKRGPLARGVEGTRMSELQSRARFPQGLPPELDRASLRLPVSP